MTAEENIKQTVDEVQSEINSKIAERLSDEKTAVDKVDGFDFHELSTDLTQSLTDQVYRRFQPALAGRYLKKVESDKNSNIRNDLLVSSVAKKIEAALADRLVETVVASVEKRVAKELDEQYHPEENSKEAKIDGWIRKSRYAILLGYFSIALVLFVIGLLVVYESILVAVQFKEMVWFAIFTPTEFSNISNAEETFISRFFLNQIVATVLSVLDLLLLAALVVMVLVGGFENTVGRIGVQHDSPTWFGKLGITELKLKVASSIVIISSIHLLTFFMLLDVTKSTLKASPDCLQKGKSAEECIGQGAYLADKVMERFGSSVYDYEALKWTAIVHGVFVFSALALAYMAKIQEEGHKASHK